MDQVAQFEFLQQGAQGMRKIFQLFLLFLPWGVRRRLLNACFSYRIDPAARIGWAWVYPDHLAMGPGARIGHLTLCKGLRELRMGAFSSIGRGNWITGFPAGHDRHFAHETDREPVLEVGDHAAVTNRHLIDCTNRVSLGEYSTLAGFGTQILTHSIDLAASRQSSRPVSIGRYCFVGTASVIVGGARLPDYSVLAAMSLLHADFSDTCTLYGGVPAKAVQALDPDLAYFQRARGFVD